MDKYALRKEYKNHLKRNAYPLAIIGGAFAILMVFIVGLLSRGMFLNARQYNTISSNDYKYVVESSSLNPVLDVYYKMEQLVTCESKAERRIHVNAYMALQDVTYDNSPLSTKQLSNNEIAVSKKVAEKLKLSVGDKLNLHIGIYEDSVEYVIVEIIDYVDDFYIFEENVDFSVIKIAYSEAIEKGVKGSYVTFLSESGLQEFQNKNFSYSEINNVGAECEILFKKILLMNIVSVSVFLIVCISYISIIKRILDKEIRKYFINGYGYKQTKKIALFDYLIWIVSPLWIGIFGFLILYLLTMFSLIILLEILGISVCLSAIFLGKVGRNYE